MDGEFKRQKRMLIKHPEPKTYCWVIIGVSDSFCCHLIWLECEAKLKKFLCCVYPDQRLWVVIGEWLWVTVALLINCRQRCLPLHAWPGVTNVRHNPMLFRLVFKNIISCSFSSAPSRPHLRTSNDNVQQMTNHKLHKSNKTKLHFIFKNIKKSNGSAAARKIMC